MKDSRRSNRRRPRWLYTNPEEFCGGFFIEREGTAVEPNVYFEETFVEPPGFTEFYEALTGLRGGYLLEGQGRAGKTWIAVAAVRRLLDSKSVDLVFSPGEDSSGLYDGSPFASDTVGQGIRQVVRELSFHENHDLVMRSRLLIFLDDLIGTSFLRSLGDRKERDLVERLLFGDPAGVLFAGTRPASVGILITGRSSVITAASLQLRGLVADRSKHYVSFPRGVFLRRDVDPLGPATRTWIDEATRRHIRFQRKHSEFKLPALSAFSQLAPKELRNSPDTSEALFGDDLREFAILLEEEEERAGEEANGLLGAFDDVMLVYLAPALVFPTRALDAVLGPKSVSALRFALKLTVEPEGELAYRVPNEFYLSAVRRFLSDSGQYHLLLRVLGRSEKRIQSSRSGSVRHDALHAWRVLLRGAFEIGIEGGSWQGYLDSGSRVNEEWATVAERARGLSDLVTDDLIRFEAAIIARDPQPELPEVEALLRYPGLASSVGWLLQSLGRRREPRGGADSTRRWMQTLIQRLERTLKIERPLDGKTIDHWPASYSNLVRWISHLEKRPGKAGLLDELFGVAGLEGMSGAASRDLSLRLRMVVEDAVIWGDSATLLPDEGDGTVDVRDLPAAQELRRSLEADIGGKRGRRGPEGEWVLVNRLFSASWHNEWCERGDASELRSVLGHWVKRKRVEGLEALRRNPGLLEQNLEYHWVHMLSQWAVWKRDWCFSSDPVAHEKERRPSGAKEPKHNAMLGSMLQVVIASSYDDPETWRRMRNSVFLLGTREGALPSNWTVRKLVRRLLRQYQEGCLPEVLGKGVACGLWELARQGAIDLDLKGSVEGKLRRIRKETREGESPRVRARRDFSWRASKFLNTIYDEEWAMNAWAQYQHDLAQSTYLEILPREPGDLCV